ncbi:LysR family transcriptional regulator [Streptomyces chartreusis]|uniref:LysR family transcriptional regulator n=1 Tax=Streptomyces chartreusis TaxID=1969 RepID=A0A7H8TIU9_STRCX|nr:LysR family transcriptional regulator [Streptomyces chartreusis]QKZ23419.1 LysR family transcriptional regulator [Streptomyces chartreusis]
MYDPRQLQVLAEVARTGTQTAAAEALGYTQPAISYQMRMLERAVGSRLVTRRGRGIHLTPAGKALARHADIVLAALRSAENELAALTAPGGGRVRLAAMQSGCVALVPRALGTLRRTHPELEVTVTQAECQVSHGLLLNDEIELAVMCDVDTVDPTAEPDTGGESLTIDPRLSSMPLLTDRRCVLMPADHPAAAQPFVSLADLAEERWVLESGRARFLAACRDAGFTPRIAATADDQLTLHHLVAHRIGLAVLNALAVTAHTDPRVVARPLTGFPVRRVFALLWPDSRNVPATAALLHALGEAALPTADGTPGIVPAATRQT